MKKNILIYLGFVGCFLMLFNPLAYGLVTWPTGSAPCDDINDIETCINGVADGEIIEIAANTIPSQSAVTVSPAKSFTLKPASGFIPVFSSFTSFFIPGSNDDITVIIEGLTIEVGNFSAKQGGSGIFDVTFKNNIVEDSLFRTALEVSSGNANPPYGPVVFLVEGNILNVQDEVVSGISIGSFSGATNNGKIINNRVIANNTGQAAVISVNASSNSTFNAEVIGNEVIGQNFNTGISLRLFGTGGFFNAKAINNVVQGQSNISGQPAAISLSNSSSVSGHSIFEIINNTLAFNQNGISYGGRSDLGAASNATIMNNIIAFNSQNGLNLSEFDSTTINDYNLIFGNTSDFYNSGANDVTKDPMFVSNLNLRLQQLSPAVGAGLNSAVPVDTVTDIDGNMRIRQLRVDIGAYESSFIGDFIFKNGFDS